MADEDEERGSERGRGISQVSRMLGPPGPGSLC